MFGDTFGSACLDWTPIGLERCSPGLLTQCMGKCTSRHDKSRDIFGYIVWLNDILSVLLAGFSPAAKFNVQFTSRFIGFPFVQGVNSQDCGRLEISAILHNESVSPVSETVGQSHIRTRPPAVAYRHLKVQIAFLIDPRICWVIRVRLAAAIACGGPNHPVITAEMEDLRDNWRDSLARRRHDGDYPIAFFGKCLDLRFRVISGFHQQRGVLGAEMCRVFPCRVVLDLSKWPVRKGLDPPNAALGIQHDLLAGSGVSHSPLNIIQLFWAARVGRWHMRQLEGRLTWQVLRMTTNN